MQSQQMLMFSHGKCANGFGAAFTAWLRLGDAPDYLACHYGDPPPTMVGRQYSQSRILSRIGRKASILPCV